MTENPKSTCRYCGASITHYGGRAWYLTGSVLPQYCFVDPVHGSRLHEPSLDNKESKNDNNR